MIKQLNLMNGLKSFSVLLGILLALGFSVSPAVAETMEVETSETETEVIDKETDIGDEMSDTVENKEMDIDDEMSDTVENKEMDIDDEMSDTVEDKEMDIDNDEMSMEKQSDQAEMNLVETAMATGGFQILVAAVQAAELSETLSGQDKFTVFAPTDEAFAALGEETLTELMKPENKDKLKAILTYHVVPGVVTSSDLEAGQVKTVQGSDIEVGLGETVMIDDATVVKADIMTSNGVIHVIDKVILPSQ